MYCQSLFFFIMILLGLASLSYIMTQYTTQYKLIMGGGTWHGNARAVIYLLSFFSGTKYGTGLICSKEPARCNNNGRKNHSCEIVFYSLRCRQPCIFFLLQWRFSTQQLYVMYRFLLLVLLEFCFPSNDMKVGCASTLNIKSSCLTCVECSLSGIADRNRSCEYMHAYEVKCSNSREQQLLLLSQLLILLARQRIQIK